MKEMPPGLPPFAPGLRILGIDPGLQVTGYAVLEVASAGAARLRGRRHPQRGGPRHN